MPIPFLAPAIISAGAGLFGSLFGAKKQSDAAYRAAKLQSQDNAAALMFMRQQAQNAYANSEVTRRANYDQWAARERRLGQLSQARGWGSREIPGYVPGVDPRFTGSVGSYLEPRRGVPIRPMPGSVGSYLR